MRGTRWGLLCRLAGLAVFALGTAARAKAEERPTLDYRIEVTAPLAGYDGKTCWMHARAGAIPPRTADNPTDTPIVVMTLQKLDVTRSDVYHGLNDLRTDDLGKTWIGPTEHESLRRRSPRQDAEVVPCDFWPTWHAASGKLLGTGATFWYSTDTNDHLKNATSETPFAVYDPKQRRWSPWQTLDMPPGEKFEFARAGCTQRVDLPNGDVLLPFYFRPAVEPDERHASAICRCRFDGEKLTYVEHGDELRIEENRGLVEPSLTRFGERYYLTLRNDKRAYVTRGADGLHFEPVRPWLFDDGTELGSYNTQQHWVTHNEGLFLVYTRRGANNDRVFRHRAPLFMAQVDPERMVVLRATERVLIPERGAAVGNFGITDVSADQTWVIATECMMPGSPEQFGSDNSVYVVKLHWNRPNKLVSSR